MDNQYHFVLIIILISLIVAAGISVLFTSGQVPDRTGSVQISPVSMVNNESLGGSETWIIRILWYDDRNRTYSFQDYPSESLPDPDTYSFRGEPPVEGAEAAMYRFLSWDGNTERTVGARYVVDQEMVTGILNRYSLTTSVAPPVPTPFPTKTPLPTATALPGMLIPELGTICRNSDGSYTAMFGYLSRHDHPVRVPVGEQNRFFPGEEDRGQPEVFMPGIHHDAFSITYPPDVTNQVWALMDTHVSAGTVPKVNTSITIEPLSGYVPLEVMFSAYSTGGTPDNPLTSTWDLGDGTHISKAGSLNHRYENPGTYRITHLVQNRCGQVMDSGIVEAYRASFIWVPGDNPATIRFTDTSGGDPSVWFWDFGDGYTSWDQNPVHTYARAGVYKTGLTVSGSHGRGTAVQSIVIDPR